jgi:hypothetical protein
MLGELIFLRAQRAQSHPARGEKRRKREEEEKEGEEEREGGEEESESLSAVKILPTVLTLQAQYS